MTGPGRREFHTSSEAETLQLGEELGGRLAPPMVVLLSGDLGAGKTVLVRGICRALGVDPREVRSPSYTLVNEYVGRCPVRHIDLYRLSGREDLAGIGLEEILSSPAIVLVEWAERLVEPPAEALRIHLSYGRSGRKRRIVVAGIPQGATSP